MIVLTRRELLAGLGASLLTSVAYVKVAEAAEKHEFVFASAFMDQQKRFGIALLSKDGNVLSTYALPARGHGFASARTTDWIVAFARRPGNFALAIDAKRMHQPKLFKTPAHTHFYGHGTFSDDGRTLLASENNFDLGQGVIGVYDSADGFRRVGEIPSFGVGPHEIVSTKEPGVVCIANGGILTHPETGRAKLNLDDMQSSVAFIDTNKSELIESHLVPKQISRLSLRHMSVDRKNAIWLGGQYQGDTGDAIPLIAKSRRGEGLAFLELEAATMRLLSNYVGSVATSADGDQIAFSSPKGGTMIVIDRASETLEASHSIDGVCGLAPSSDGVSHSSLTGHFNGRRGELLWDNHLIQIDTFFSDAKS